MADIKTWSLTSNFKRIEVSTRNSIGPNLGFHWVRGRVIEYSLIKIPTLRSMLLSFWFSSSVTFLSSGYQSVNMNGKDNWVEWRHPQYFRDKSSSPLRQAAVERTSREIRIRRNASKFTMSVSALHMSIWARPDAHKWRFPHLSAVNIGVRCGEAQRLDTRTLYLHLTKYIAPPPHYLPTLPCHKKMELPSCRWSL